MILSARPKLEACKNVFGKIACKEAQAGGARIGGKSGAFKPRRVDQGLGFYMRSQSRSSTRREASGLSAQHCEGASFVHSEIHSGMHGPVVQALTPKWLSETVSREDELALESRQSMEERAQEFMGFRP